MARTARWAPTWRALEHDPAAVRHARLTRKWSQRRLAAEVGISRSYMCEIESGTRNAGPELLAKIARALRCSLSNLERRGMAA